MKRALLTLLAVVAGITGSTLCLEGSSFGQCTDPVASGRTEVNVVILPYVDETGSLPEAAEQLTFLLEQQALRQNASYGELTIVRLTGDPKECNLTAARTTILKGYTRRPREAFVFVSGYLFRVDDEVRVQTFVTLERHGELPSFGVEGEGIYLAPEVPLESLPLMPRTLSKVELDATANEFLKSARLYDQPVEGAASRPLASDFAKSAHYSVVSSRKGWTLISGSAGYGWLKAESGTGSRYLSTKLPELLFLEAMVGSFRSLPWRQDAEQPSRSARAEDAAARFTLQADEDGRTVAWLEIIRALMVLSRSDSWDALQRAKVHLDRAVEMIPEDANTRILRAAVLSQLVRRGLWPVKYWKQAKKDLLVATARGLEPGLSRRYHTALRALSPSRGWSLEERLSLSVEQLELIPFSTDEHVRIASVRPPRDVRVGSPNVLASDPSPTEPRMVALLPVRPRPIRWNRAADPKERHVVFSGGRAEELFYRYFCESTCRCREVAQCTPVAVDMNNLRVHLLLDGVLREVRISMSAMDYFSARGPQTLWLKVLKDLPAPEVRDVQEVATRLNADVVFGN